jgi:hypothetical protein
VKSATALVQPVTEFGCQGLELDLPIVCWGEDFNWDGTSWQLTPVRRRSLQQDPQQLLTNVYRVLLTRGRDASTVPSQEFHSCHKIAKIDFGTLRSRVRIPPSRPLFLLFKGTIGASPESSSRFHGTFGFDRRVGTESRSAQPRAQVVTLRRRWRRVRTDPCRHSRRSQEQRRDQRRPHFGQDSDARQRNPTTGPPPARASPQRCRWIGRLLCRAWLKGKPRLRGHSQRLLQVGQRTGATTKSRSIPPPTA